MENWHLLPAADALQKADTTEQGLSAADATARLSANGRNELTAKKKRSPIIIFFRQFLDVMILVLVAAAVISGFIGEASDTIVILIIILLNAVVGFVQEYRAEKAMAALQKIAMPESVVLRDGQQVSIHSAELVVGDIVLLEAGNRVPADLRLLEAHSLKTDESALTGESAPVDKITDALEDAAAPVGDRLNMAFSGSSVTNGRGKGVVIATAMQTELGRIANMLQEDESSTPLQKRMSAFSKKLTVIILVLCALLFLAGYLRGEEPYRMLLTAISLAVAAIPEALPAVITVSLALGARRLARQNALIRKLYAVETLGSVTYICTDKTGTLTKNKMEVKAVWMPHGVEEKTLLQAMRHNHDVKEKDGSYKGDPTEIAMLDYALAAGKDNEQDEALERVQEIPFDSDRKAMTTIHNAGNGKYMVVTKGSPEAIADMVSGTLPPNLKEEEEKMAADGMRVIGFATKEIDALPADITPEAIEKDLVFIGLAGLIDPPREEAKAAIAECKAAGIVPVMITGDHPLTAASIARELGILDGESQKAVTGRELDAMSEQEFEDRVEGITVYARVSPEQKLSIVKALQKKDHFVSMTGDGVNDAPSLRRANIGVAMGITGTDVTREAGHMILLDDNFATIIKAVQEGRRIYDNIRKFIKYIMTGNAAEILCLFLAPILGLPIPLLPVHILWVNLVTDGLPALALAVEPAEKAIMRRRPRKTNESIFSGGLGRHVILMGLLVALLTVGTQWVEIKTGSEHWQTIVFTILCFSQLWHVLAIRSETQSLFTQGLLSNKPLLGTVLLTVALQLAVIYLPFLNSFFHTQPLTALELLVVFAVSGITFLAVELEKWIKRRRK